MNDTIHRENELSREEVWSLVLLEKDEKVEAHQLAGVRHENGDEIEIDGLNYKLTTDVVRNIDRYDLRDIDKGVIENAINSFSTKTQSPNTNGGIFWAELVKLSE